jgi:phosphohistidine phosphatase
MDLFIIRHAWAGEYGDPAWSSDFERPLTDEGRRRFARMVELLVDRGLAPEVIATSPMTRCVQTAEVLAAGVSGKPQIVPRDELLPGSNLQDLVAWTAKQARHCQQVAWVGHAPDVGRMAAALLGQADDWLHFSKGTVCCLRFPGSPQSAYGEMRWLVTAKILGC